MIRRCRWVIQDNDFSKNPDIREPDRHRRGSRCIGFTVSKVLNGRSDVAPETRERLGAILRLHGYQVAPRAGIGVVDLLIGRLGSPWADELIRGAITAATETEISVIVSRVTSAGEFDRWLKIASARGTRGALSVLHLPDSATLRRLADAHVPLVVIDPPADPRIGPLGGHHELAGRRDRSPAPHRTGPPADRRHRRAGRAVVLPGEARRLPQRHAPGGPARR